MLKLFNKKRFSVLLALLSLITAGSSLSADDCCCYQDCVKNRLYIGGFGGQLFSNKTKFIQRGTAFFSEAAGGPLAVIAHGHSRKKSPGFGGAQIGYEWRQAYCFSDWSVNPAAEFEALFYRHKAKAHLINPTVRLPEHDFANKFPTDIGVYLFNAVISLNNCCFSSFSPYVGGGVGAANLCIRKADSLQVAPLEAGINHFNSDRTDTTWALAAQAKVGLRYNFCERFHIFGEYRFLYVDSSRFLFGSTDYPTHVPTSTWDVDRRSSCYNAYVFGIQVDLY